MRIHLIACGTSSRNPDATAHGAKLICTVADTYLLYFAASSAAVPKLHVLIRHSAMCTQ
jgi:hypothetical protein